jgi:hypothetical protein
MLEGMTDCAGAILRGEGYKPMEAGYRWHPLFFLGAMTGLRKRDPKRGGTNQWKPGADGTLCFSWWAMTGLRKRDPNCASAILRGGVQTNGSRVPMAPFVFLGGR